MSDRSDVVEAWDYVTKYYSDPDVQESFRLLREHAPSVFAGYIGLRRAAFDGAESTLSPQVKELVIIGMECVARKTNPPPVFHARKAVEAGATVAEIAEIVALSIMIGGMMTYQDAGQFVLREAERTARMLDDPKKADSTQDAGRGAV